MGNELKVGLIAGSAQVIAALIALFGVLLTAGGAGSVQGKDTVSSMASAAPTASAASGVAATPTGNTSCLDVVERYRRIALQDPKLLAALGTPGPDGISPLEADPDARRCGISEATLRDMR
jgi:hypothetical protein